jgi:hypothetical protein
MDGHGFVFSSAPAFSGQTYEEIFAPFVGSPIGKRYLLDDQLSAIRRVTKGITAITSRSPLVSSTLERTYYLGRDQLTLLFTDTGHSNRWLLRLTVATSTSEILNNFDSVVTADIFAKDFQKNKGRLEYFDLRFGRKIYYRFR